MPPPGRGVSGALPGPVAHGGCTGQGDSLVPLHQGLLWEEEGQAAVTLVVSVQQQPQSSPVIPALSPFLPLAVAQG